MPSASTATCQQCQLQPSKYTCPTCKARTCSLACTKLHKAQICTSSASSSARSAPGTASSPSAAIGPASSTSITSNERAPVGFVSLAGYNESHMLQDYLFLSGISRNAAEEGRRILNLNLPIPSSTTSPSTVNAYASSSKPNTGGRITNQQRAREQLMKQVHYRKFKVMLLPEGMARRKLNQSSFSGKSKRLDLTIEVKPPANVAGVEKGKEGGGWIVGKVDSERKVGEILLDDLQFRSFVSKKDVQKARETLQIAAKEKQKSWVLARKVLVDAGLPIPNKEEKMKEEGEYVVLKEFPKQWAVLVPVYSARLKNESTTQYLDWCNRKRRWEEANPELAAQQRIEAEAQQERQAQNADSLGQNQGERNVRPRKSAQVATEVKDEVEKHTEAKVGSGAKMDDPSSAAKATAVGGRGGEIVSSFLLSLLSERLGRTQPSSDPPSTTTTQIPTPPAATTQPIDKVRPTSPTKASETSSAKSILVHLTQPGKTSLAWLLRNLPDGYSVVEFPEFRLVPTAHLATGGIVELGPEEDLSASPGAGKGRQKEGDDEGKKQPTAAIMGSNTSLTGLLAGYRSDSDSDGEEAAAEQEKRATDDDGPSLANLASKHGFVAHSRQ
ncbi:uncharacterized protein UHOD_03195 [Ustilago sp. UG-2017b]|nr:uncharacterized protein UHOD_03195 [Ustilago sp. UG-2017b]